MIAFEMQFTVNDISVTSLQTRVRARDKHLINEEKDQEAFD